MEDQKYGVRVLEKVGSGGFGNVYKCTYKGKTHVVKKVAIGHDLTFNFKSVQAEFDILSKVKHPCILSLIKFYQTSQDWNFVLEYMQRGSLRTMIQNFNKNCWKFGQDDLLALFMDAVVGVRHLHARGILHRDLKPENILVDAHHRLKIADFGISKLCEGSPDFHTAIGTIHYMAPEVYLQRPYDKAIDVWALGIILYEMAMMRYPFSKADKARILNPVLHFVPPVIDCARRNYDPALQDLLVLLLQRDPKKRVDLNTFCAQKLVKRFTSRLMKEYLDTLN